MKPYFVYLGQCSQYDAGQILAILKQAAQAHPAMPEINGRVVIKPNLVMAHPRVATEAYTRKEVMEGILLFLKEYGTSDLSACIVEKSGLGITTSAMFRYAGYQSLKKKFGTKLVPMEESEQKRLVLKNGKIHSYITVAKEMAENDFLIFAPKLKTNVLSGGFSGAIKLNIGSIDSKERMFCHHHALPQKMVDILTVLNPQLVVTDGIRLAYGGNQMTQRGVQFGVIAVSNNAVAHDIVCASMLGLDPFKIEHIQEAISRGLGPGTMEEIDVLGDFDMEKGMALAKSLEFGNIPVESFQSNFEIQSGQPFCQGGCHGIFLDWLHMVQDRKPKLMKRFPKIPVCIGKIENKIVSKKVLLIGECAAASPNIRSKSVIKIGGCPPTHKAIVLKMLMHFFLINPLVRPSLIWDGFVAYPIKKMKGWWINRLYKPSMR